jgi:hypothetical protein
MNRRTLILTAFAAALTRVITAENAGLHEAFPTAGSGQGPSRVGTAKRYAYSIVDAYSVVLLSGAIN